VQLYLQLSSGSKPDSSILPNIILTNFSFSGTLISLYDSASSNFTTYDVAASGHLTSFGPAELSQTPLPAALPLFATGLGALGLLGWRRKRKNTAAIAAA
jgi:hypothetical protein